MDAAGHESGLTFFASEGFLGRPAELAESQRLVRKIGENPCVVVIQSLFRASDALDGMGVAGEGQAVDRFGVKQLEDV
jgi:hypothetical protein